MKKLYAFFNRLGFYGGRGATSYEFQFRSYVFRWCFLKGGHWKSYWQLSRFSLDQYPYP